MKNKKAVLTFTKKLIMWMIAGVIFTTLLIFLGYMITSYGQGLTEISPELKETFYVYRFLNNPKCLAYQDKLTGRTDTGSIDLSKFTDERLSHCYKTNSSQDYNFMLKLKNRNISVKTSQWWNVIQHTIIKNVRVYDKGNITDDQMFIYVQRKI